MSNRKKVLLIVGIILLAYGFIAEIINIQNDAKLASLGLNNNYCSPFSFYCITYWIGRLLFLIIGIILILISLKKGKKK